MDCYLCNDYKKWKANDLILVRDAGATAILHEYPDIPGQIILFP